MNRRRLSPDIHSAKSSTLRDAFYALFLLDAFTFTLRSQRRVRFPECPSTGFTILHTGRGSVTFLRNKSRYTRRGTRLSRYALEAGSARYIRLDAHTRWPNLSRFYVISTLAARDISNTVRYTYVPLRVYE